MDMIPGNPKHDCDPHMRGVIYKGPIINGRVLIKYTFQ